MFNVKHRVITMKVSDLLEALKKNREIHAAEFEEAKAAFIERMESDLKLALKKTKTGNFDEIKNIRLYPKVLENHVREYDEAIQMLQYTTTDIVEIDSETFRAYVNNEWAWSDTFKNVLNTYKVAGSMLS